ncbi:aldo/keto reductase [Flavobacteriaceae bacterium]|nr:aldo/keto reductase [Flavobacteriaceae bacterium]MDC1540176.1 aldo/keto reductase [Flavobacteriaceae bacterium]
MKYTTLPSTAIKVSKICLGSMTWGNQNTEAEGHAQMDFALDHGVNFFDTAELYPVPATAETQGLTSKYIGTWLKKNNTRDKVIIASKIAGIGDYTAHIRTAGFSAKTIKEAIDLELGRLQTDYIDLYQLHWPERHTNTFGVRDFKPSPNDPWVDNFNAVLHALESFVKAGKIRAIGISNEKAWGTMRYVEEIRKDSLTPISTAQNAYSLLNRTYEGDLAEVSLREDIGLLAYSPLAFGVLSGKYIEGTAADNARLKLFPRFARYSSAQSTEATKQYLKLARDLGISLTTLALAFVNQRPFVTSNIIGATNLDQLKENIESINTEFSQETLDRIDAIHAGIPNPAP